MVSTAAGVSVVALEAQDGIVYTLAFMKNPKDARRHRHAARHPGECSVRRRSWENGARWRGYGGEGPSWRIRNARRYLTYARVRGRTGHVWYCQRAALHLRQIQNNNSNRFRENTHRRRQLTNLHTRATLHLSRSDVGSPGSHPGDRRYG